MANDSDPTIAGPSDNGPSGTDSNTANSNTTGPSAPGQSTTQPSDRDSSHSNSSDSDAVPSNSDLRGDRKGSNKRSAGSSIKFITAGIALLLIAFIGVLATREAHSNDRASRMLGLAAPQITGVSLLDGKAFDLNAQKGKFVVVNYFATWCPACVLEHPELVAFSNAHPEVAMVSVVFQDSNAGVRAFFAKKGGTWPVLDSERAAVDFGVRGVPETYLISPAGQLVFQTNGGVTKRALENAISRSSGQSE